MPHALMPAELAEIIATHNAFFGGFTMMADEPEQKQPEQKPEQEQSDEDKPLGPAGERALQAVRDENRALRGELNDFKKSLGEALGIEGKKPDVDDIGQLRAEMAALRKENTVQRIARTHGITDEADIALLMDAAPELATKLAERLKPSADSGATPPSNTPKPDPSVGKGNGGGTRPSSVQQAMDEYRASRARKTNQPA